MNCTFVNPPRMTMNIRRLTKQIILSPMTKGVRKRGKYMNEKGEEIVPKEMPLHMNYADYVVYTIDSDGNICSWVIIQVCWMIMCVSVNLI